MSIQVVNSREAKMLPPPLADPLKTTIGLKAIGYGLLAPIFVVATKAVIESLIGVTSGRLWRYWDRLDAVKHVNVMVLSGALLGLLWILPWRRTNAIYLRSFKNDPATWPRRAVVSRALGPSFRLSGIRDPRRRWPAVFRVLLNTLFVFRYSTPKFMNLEAGNGWANQLWRSLGHVRCVFIDLTGLTVHVHHEIRICANAIGLQRIFFIADRSAPREHWISQIQQSLGDHPVEEGSLNLEVWEDARRGRRQFAASVRRFAAKLPFGEPQVKPETVPFPGIPRSLWKKSYALRDSAAGFLLLFSGIVGGFLFAKGVELASIDPGVILGALGLLLLPWFCFFGAQYLWQCGSTRDRLTFALLFFPTPLSLVIVPYLLRHP